MAGGAAPPKELLSGQFCVMVVVVRIPPGTHCSRRLFQWRASVTAESEPLSKQKREAQHYIHPLHVNSLLTRTCCEPCAPKRGSRRRRRNRGKTGRYCPRLQTWVQSSK